MCVLSAEKTGCICVLFRKVLHMSLEGRLFGSGVGPSITLDNLGSLWLS